jgi:hypothetical protein
MRARREVALVSVGETHRSYRSHVTYRPYTSSASGSPSLAPALACGLLSSHFHTDEAHVVLESVMT